MEEAEPAPNDPRSERSETQPPDDAFQTAETSAVSSGCVPIQEADGGPST
jgi:hypothetical protein